MPLDFNWISYLFIAFFATNLAIEYYLLIRHRRHIAQHSQSVPEEFVGSVSAEEHLKAANYTRTKTALARWTMLIDAIILLWLSVGGGLQYIYQLPIWSFFTGIDLIAKEIAFILGTVMMLSIINLPFTLYSTFSIEEKFGFNKTTPQTFVTDLLKQSVLAILLGSAVLWVLLTLMSYFIDGLWWLWAWVFWSLFSLFLIWVYPIWIAPLFNKFEPLKDEALKQSIETLLSKTGFNSSGVFVMDGSKRSGHGNAYFTGFGKNKRIVFFDTLITSLTTEEIEAVLAHELGHYAHGHIKRRLLESFAFSLIGFAMIGYVLTWQDYFSAFQVVNNAHGLVLMVVMQTLPVFFFFSSPLNALRSRKQEFEADAYAVKHANGNALISALVKLHRDNASTLTPDPLYSAYHSSHPPASIRINHIKQCLTEKTTQ